MTTSSIVNKFEASLTDAAIDAIYNHHMFIAQATERPHSYMLDQTEKARRGRTI